MSYSLPRMASFSDALGAVHVAMTPAGAVAAATENIARHETAEIEDEAYLAELIAAHVADRSCALDRAKANSHLASGHAPESADFHRLRARRLTPRECDVTFWIAQGKRDAEIAAILGCAPKTVSKHVENLLAKLGAETRLSAALAAQEWLKQND